MFYPLEEFAWAAAQERQLNARRMRRQAEARAKCVGPLRAHLARKLVAAGLRLDRHAAESSRKASVDAALGSGVASPCVK